MASPTRGEIKPRVIANISVISGYDPASIEEGHRLKEDLYMSEAARGVLAPGFEVVARDHNPNAVITKTECKALKTVKASIDLVWSRAKGAGS